MHGRFRNSTAGADRGIVLVLMSGMLVMLFLLAAAFLLIVRLAGMGAAVRAHAAQTRLSAVSGLEYAAARLWLSTDRKSGGVRYGDPAWSPDATRPTASNRGEDWYFRAFDHDDGSVELPFVNLPESVFDPALSITTHPSYAHGESWVDADDDGLFDPGESDAGGDGRLLAYSGRLRTGAPGEGRFNLRIEAEGTRIPLGMLPGDSFSSQASILNQLGAVLGIRHVDYDAGNPSLAQVRWSDLGDRLGAVAPADGYRSWESLRAALDAILPPGQSTKAERLLRRYVACRYDGSLWTSKILLNAIPPRLIEATLRYRVTTSVDPMIPSADLGAYATGSDPNTGSPGLAYSAYPSVSILHPPEAHDAAWGIWREAARRGGFMSWNEFSHFVDRNKRSWFPCAGLRDSRDPAEPNPYILEARQNVKADMVFRAFHGFDGTRLPQGIATSDLDRFLDPRPGPPLDLPGPGRNRRKTSVVALKRIPAPDAGYTGDQPYDGTALAMATSFDSAPNPPSSFSVWSESRWPQGYVSCEGSVQVVEDLLLYSQEHFAHLGGYPPPWGNSQQTEIDPVTRTAVIQGTPTYSESGGTRTAVVSWKFPMDVFDHGVTPRRYPSEGGIALGRTANDLIGLTGALADVSFPYLIGPDASCREHFLMDDPNGGLPFPTKYCNPDPSNPQAYESDTEMRRDLNDNSASSVSGLTIGNLAGFPIGAQNVFLFDMQGSSPPVAPTPPLPVPTLNASGTADAIASCAFHFTYVGEASGSQTVFALSHPGYTAPPATPTDNRVVDWRLLVDAANRWTVRIRRMVMTNDFEDRSGTFRPPAPDVVDPAAPKAVWDDRPAPRRITVYYIVRRDPLDMTGKFPPSEIRWGVFIDGQHVVDAAWDKPALPFPANMPPFLMCNYFGDQRRWLYLMFRDCAEAAFFVPTLPTHPANDLNSTMQEITEAHEVYRMTDFYRRSGAYTSPRYILREPMALGRLDWEGMVPEHVREAVDPSGFADIDPSNPRNRILSLAFRFYDESGVQIGPPIPIAPQHVDPVTVPIYAQAGWGPFCMPVGADLWRHLDRRAKSFDFQVSFDCGGFGTAPGYAGWPLRDTPVVDGVRLQCRTRPQWWLIR